VEHDETFRAEARAWLAAHAPATRERLDAATTDLERFGASRGWQRLLFDGGWAGITWPVEYGGRGGTAREASIFAEEQAKFRVSSGFVASTVGMVGPTLIRFGTDAQRDRYLKPLLRADEAWCQLFSEPVAGSDLANLATRAERDGDDFVVNGQKVWTSNAHLCDFAILLARTDLDAPKHRGITFFVVDLRMPGIDVRPLRQITGAAHFNEVFLTDVRIPATNVVGEINGGWAPARTVLAHEASGIGAGNAAAAGCAALLDLARATGRNADPLVRQQLARAYSREAI
jgi:alkylation response protein AidB-like acyl-CoA dehydrogenase